MAVHLFGGVPARPGCKKKPKPPSEPKSDYAAGPRGRRVGLGTMMPPTHDWQLGQATALFGGGQQDLAA